MNLPPLTAKADMPFNHHCATSALRAATTLLIAVLVCACATEPVVPPTELVSINAESKLERLWSQKLGKSEKGRFEPLALNGVVYAASRTGEVVAIDQANGKQKWVRQLPVTLSSGIGGLDDRLFVSSNDGQILALSATDGELLWEVQASSEVLTPVSSGYGKVIVRSADGRLLSLDPATGDEQWSVTYTPPALTINGYSRPLLLDGGVLVGLDDGRLMALKSDSGNVLWESVISVASGRSEVERLADIDGSIRVDETAIYAVSYQGKLARVEPAKGQIVWSVPMSSTAGLAISNTAVFVVGDDDEIHAFDKTSGQLLWKQAALKHRRLSAPTTLGENQVLVGDLEGYLHVLDATDGRLLGRSRVAKKSIFSEIILSENTVDGSVEPAIVVQSADGNVAQLRAVP